MSSRRGPQYLSNLSNTIINNPIITHADGDVVLSPEHRSLTLLLENISKGAFHDAAERGDPPKCHPHTRVAIRAEIMEWIKAPEASHKLILWMYGPAGAGKTAIEQSIAEECEDQGLLAASFFFSRNASGRNNTRQLAATIAYQISRCFPQIENHLFAAIEKDPAIFSRNLATQIQVLVIEPLSSLPSSLNPILVILDGIDEIGPDRQSQTDLLNVIGSTTSELQHLPLVFLIASRPEYEIRTAFNSSLLCSLSQSLVLDDTYEPDDDIRRYLSNTLERIRGEHLKLGTHLPSPWPSASDVTSLVSKASGQFIYAATVLKYIDSPRHDPQERLNTILSISARGNETPFAVLDALYRYILASVADLTSVLEILMVLHIDNTYWKNLLRGTVGYNIKDVESLLGVNVRTALVDMHALMYIPPSHEHGMLPSIYHASFTDFLMDQSRSHQYHIDTNQAHVTLSLRWLKAVFRKGDISLDLPKPMEGFIFHCRRSPVSCEIANALSCYDFKQCLQIHKDNGEIYWIDWNDFFECVRKQAGTRIDIISRLQDQFDGFFLEHLSMYPPSLQTFIPSILTLSEFIDNNTILGDIFHIILHGTAVLPNQYKEFLGLDKKLLRIDFFAYIRGGSYPTIFSLFQDKSRAGQYFVSDQSYLALIKQVIDVISPRFGEDIKALKLGPYRYHLSEEMEFYNADGCPNLKLYDLGFKWFGEILSKVSTDLDLAHVLRERVLPYDIPGRLEMINASLDYIERCGLPVVMHPHFADMTRCIVCEWYEWDKNTVVVNPDVEGSQSSVLFPCVSTPESMPCTGEVHDLPNDPDILSAPLLF